MEIPLQVSFRGVSAPPDVHALCLAEVEKLARFHGRITSCRVVVGEPNRRHEKGNLFSIHLRLGIPGGELEVNRECPEHQAHEELRTALRDAFHAARRRLQDFVRRQDGRVRLHRPREPRA